MQRVDHFLWLFLRVITGALMVPHGMQKLFGMFGSPGIERLGQIFESQAGLEPGVPFVILTGTVELLGGLGLIFGVLTRLSALGLFSVLSGAIVLVNASSGFFWTNGGIEYPILWASLCLCFIVRGGGRYGAYNLIVSRRSQGAPHEAGLLGKLLD